MNLTEIQAFLTEQQLDGWLVHDFRGSNPALAQLFPPQKWLTRRVACLIPRQGVPKLAVHQIDAPQWQSIPAEQTVYLTWQDWQQWLRESLRGCSRLAMEFSPAGLLPQVAYVDAGTIDFIRSLGCEVVSSADVLQLATARWSAEAHAGHLRAAKLVDQIKEQAFGLIRMRLRQRKKVTEHSVQQFILRRFAEEKLDPDHPPIVAVNEHSADPHFEVSAEGPAEIRRGDWVLIDLWARWPGEEHIFADITWVGFAGEQVPEEHQRVFDTVKQARDAALHRAQSAWRQQQQVRGCDLDDAAMEVLRAAGYAANIVHRTGHSLSPGPKIHGLGVNIDNFESRDTRRLLPGIGFTIEPGVYLPGKFGCRLEINVFVDPVEGPVLTSASQQSPVLL
ncbi:MAG: Xaa-Pro peptidase family protein [Phycisphaerae bacterium]|nr:Xaa-Pro peptidase family protein [Phycisphaerae bacterium]MDW8262664.1 Xaa-Pro peptidase family protein [Phycisphaerales bacterium]